jgi:DNA-directed RNA polymerase specialized sigma24 family protein
MPDSSTSLTISNQPSDENLIFSFLAGDESALNILIERYLNPLKFHLYKKISWSKDTSFIEEIITEAVARVLQAIKSGSFKPTTAGLFKAFLFATTEKTCWEMNRKQKRLYKATSEVFPKEPTGIPEDIFPRRVDSDIGYYDYLRLKLQKVLPLLNEQERRLLELVSEGKSYEDAQKDPLLCQHPVDYLKLMMYNIKKKIKGKEE